MANAAELAKQLIGNRLERSCRDPARYVRYDDLLGAIKAHGEIFEW